MGGRAQKQKKPTTLPTPEVAADVMMDAVTKYVAKKLSENDPKRDWVTHPSTNDWGEYKQLKSRLDRLLDQTAFIAGIMTGEVD